MTNQIVAKTRMDVKIRGQNPWLCKVKPTLTALHDLYDTKVSALQSERSRSKWTYIANSETYTPTIIGFNCVCAYMRVYLFYLENVKKMNVNFTG